MKTVNLNSSVRAELSAEGARHLSKQEVCGWEWTNIKNESCDYHEGQVIEGSLWKIMHYFGPMMSVGLTTMFKDNAITILD